MLKKYVASALVAMSFLGAGVAHAESVAPVNPDWKVQPEGAWWSPNYTNGSTVPLDGYTVWDNATSSLTPLLPLSTPTWDDGVTPAFSEFTVFSGNTSLPTVDLNPIVFNGNAAQGQIVWFSLISYDTAGVGEPDSITLTYTGCNCDSQTLSTTSFTDPTIAQYWAASFVPLGATGFTLTLANGDHFNNAIGGVAVTPVPEPETFALLAAGLGVIGSLARRRRNNA